MHLTVNSVLHLPTPRRRVSRYLLALGICVGATLVRLGMDPLVHDQVPFFVYVAAVVFATWFCGIDGGILCTAAATLAGNYFFVQPRHVLSFSIEDSAAMALFAALALVLVWSVGQWRRAETAVRALQAQTEAIIHQLPVAVVVADGSGTLILSNSAAERIFRAKLDGTQMTVAEFRERSGYLALRKDGSVIPPEQATMFRAIKGEAVAHDEVHFVWRDGTRTIVSAHAAPIRDAEGQITGAVLGLIDISDQQAAAMLAGQRAEELEAVLDTVPAAVFITQDLDARSISGNRAASEILHVPHGSNLSMTAPEGDRPDTFRVMSGGNEIPAAELPVQRAARGQETRDSEIDFVYPDGTQRTLFGNARPLRDGAGQVRGAVAAFVDITERKRLETELQRRMDELESIYEFAPIGLCVLDREGRYVRVNRKLAELNGLPVEEHIGRTVPEVVKLEEAARSVMSRVLAGETVLDVPLVGELPSQPGVVRHFVEQWFPIRDASGSVTGVNVAVNDVTSLKNTETELRQIGDARAQVNRTKDEFLSVLSHELRTPVNAILGWSEILLRHGVNTDTAQKALEAINRNARAECALINDVLDVSRIVSGKLRLDVRPIDLAAVVQAALDTVRPAADAKEIKTTLSVEPHSVLIGDPERLQQIVWNLVSNGVKFSHVGGRIDVTVRHVDSQIEIRVRDDGTGIAPEFLPHVFERFRQRDSSTTRATQSGLGLGLAIVRHLTELHGGTVRARSEGEGQGAEFVVTLPVRSVCEPQSETERTAEQVALHDGPPADGALASVRVLVVDDQPDGRTLLETVLRRVGAEVFVCASAAEALEAVERQSVQVVVADIAMPEMDGYEMLRRLRAFPVNGSVPAIALTSLGGPEDRRRALEVGYQEHVAKPVSPDTLIGVIASVLRSANVTPQVG